MRDLWAAEIEAACDWWAERIIEATRVAFPPASVFGPSGLRLSHPDNILAFRERLFAEIEDDFLKRSVAWNPKVVIEGATHRRIGKTGHFLSMPLVAAAYHCDLSEAAEVIPDGCYTVISPGIVFATLDKKSKETVIKVAPRLRDREAGGQGDGI